MNFPLDNRVAIFEGPNQILESIETLAKPEVDGVMIYDAVDQKFAT